MPKYVWGYGSKPNDHMVLSQGPGRAEGQIGKPFVGPSGDEHKMYLSFFDLKQSQFYTTNLMKEWRENNPKPTAEDIDLWGPTVKDEIKQCQPKVIAAVGAMAAKWLLEPHYPDIDLSMTRIHGLAFPVYNTFPSDLKYIVIPIEHPASGLKDKDGRQKASIMYDYSQFALAIDSPDKCRHAHLNDPFKGDEDYRSINYDDVIRDGLLSPDLVTVLSIDTEGNLRHKAPESIQFSGFPGTGYSLRIDAWGFEKVIDMLQHLVDTGIPIIVHNALFDIPMCRLMGLELSRCNIHDTMEMLYNLGGWERKGLDTAGWRFCGAATDHFLDVVGEASRDRQIDYLQRAAQVEWPKPDQMQVRCNDGTQKLYRPKGFGAKLNGILRDIVNDKRDKDGNPVDPEDRFYRPAGGEQFHKDISAAMVGECEREMGPFPWPSLRDVDDETATYYECRDADIPLRLWYALQSYLDNYNVRGVYECSMQTLPAIEEIQHTGIPGSRKYFVGLKPQLESLAFNIQDKLSVEFFDDEPFNVKSNPQTVQLLEKLGVKGLERTPPSKKFPKGQLSTKADSILHLQASQPAIRDLFRARHLRHLAASFCRPFLDRADPHTDISFVHSKWSSSSTTTRRLKTSGKDRKGESGFNLLAQPSRGTDSLLIRKGYTCPEGYTFVSADLSQIEPRVLTHFSQDKNLMDVYLNDRDLYVETACLMEGLTPEEVSPDTRKIYKIFMLGLMYGFGGFTMMKQYFMAGVFDLPIEVIEDNYCEGAQFRNNGNIIIDQNVCEIMLQSWYDKHDGVTEFKRQLSREVYRTGIITCSSGMPRYVPDIRSKNRAAKSQAQRWIVSHKIQGTAQDIIQSSMAWLIRQLWALRDRGVDIRLCLQYHDELVTICPENVADMVGQLIRLAMTDHTGIELSVPLQAEPAVGKTWADLK